MTLSALSTPCVVIGRATALRNIARMQAAASAPAPDRIILDSGGKTLTNDGARGFLPTPGVGEVLDHPNLLVERLSNHSCVVSHLVDHAWLIDGHDATALEIAARGRIT